MATLQDYIDVFERFTKAKDRYCIEENGFVIRMSFEFAEGLLSFLKEQEAKLIAYTDNPYTKFPVARCPKCGKFARQFHMEYPEEETKHCPWCGQAVKWK